jgi:thiol-disulfide isomerase/thioredoxin
MEDLGRGANALRGPEVDTTVEVPGHKPAGRPALVLFTSSACEQCKALEPGLQRIHALYGPDADNGHQLDLVAVLTDRDANGRADHARELGTWARTDLIALMQDWKVPGTPFAVALDAEHRVKGAQVVNGQMDVEVLAVETLGVLFIPREDRGEHAFPLEVEQINGDRSHSTPVLR